MLIDAVSSHPSLDDICLENCIGEDVNGYEVLQSIIAGGDSFIIISFTRNNMRTGSGTTISDFIARNPPLKELSLESNNLNDKDAVLISRALKHNSNMLELNLSGNNITEIGFTALRNAVNDTTSLNTVSDSNHTCVIEGIVFGDIPRNPCSSAVTFSLTKDEQLRSYLTSNKGRKIYHLLCTRNREGSNVRQLNLEFGDEDDEDDDSIKLVPKVLESIHHYENLYTRKRRGDTSYVPPLSIMFEVLRSWKMPELYERR